jgi:hypothetical protein
LLTVIDLLQRGGVGSLERRADGQVVFVFADLDELPSPEEAWERSQPELDDLDPTSRTLLLPAVEELQLVEVDGLLAGAAAAGPAAQDGLQEQHRPRQR